jgi:hypothetical protein
MKTIATAAALLAISTVAFAQTPARTPSEATAPVSAVAAAAGTVVDAGTKRG